MTSHDYGHDLLFGTFLTPQNQRPQDVVDLARLAEQVGLDLVTFQDHPAQMEAWGRGILVVVHDFRDAADDLAAGLQRLQTVPWWRVYWVGPSPDHVRLVGGDRPETGD